MRIPLLQITLILSILTLALTEQQQQQQQQQQEFELYAQQLGDFIPTQAFQFQLNPTQKHIFIYWPSHQTKTLRGMFYITSEDVQGLQLECQTGGIVQKTFKNKRIGVFSVPYLGEGDMKLIFKSQQKKLRVYLSYQLIQPKQKPKDQQLENTTQIAQFIQQFTHIKNTLIGQQQILKSMVISQIRQTDKLKNEINSKTTRVIIQTIIIIISGIISIIMLKRQFKKGYQLIV